MRPLEGRVAGALALLAVVATRLGAGAAGLPESLLTQEWFRYDCRSELSSEDVTLFGNGTVRLRRGLDGRRVMQLAELEPSELADWRARLEELSFEEVDRFGAGVSGEWVDQCTIETALPARESQRLRFHRLDSLSLDLQRAVDLGRELIDLASLRAPYSGLPRDYEPEPGDILRRGIGGVFEVVGFTSDGRGVELVGLDQPLQIYVALADLRQVFVSLETDPDY